MYGNISGNGVLVPARNIARLLCRCAMMMMMMSFARGAYLREMHAAVFAHWRETRLFAERNTIFYHIFGWNTRAKSLRCASAFAAAAVAGGFGSSMNSKSIQSHKIPLMLVVYFRTAAVVVAAFVHFICIRTFIICKTRRTLARLSTKLNGNTIFSRAIVAFVSCRHRIRHFKF